jgi:hypothetical protein
MSTLLAMLRNQGLFYALTIVQFIILGWVGGLIVFALTVAGCIAWQRFVRKTSLSKAVRLTFGVPTRPFQA